MRLEASWPGLRGLNVSLMNNVSTVWSWRRVSLCAFSDVWLSHAAAGMRLNQEFVSLSSTAREENPVQTGETFPAASGCISRLCYARLLNGRPLFGHWLNYAKDHFITVVVRNCFRMSYTLLVLLMTVVFGPADLTIRMLIMSMNMKTYWYLLYLQNEKN